MPNILCISSWRFITSTILLKVFQNLDIGSRKLSMTKIPSWWASELRLVELIYGMRIMHFFGINKFIYQNNVFWPTGETNWDTAKIYSSSGAMCLELSQWAHALVIEIYSNISNDFFSLTYTTLLIWEIIKFILFH